MQFIFPVVFLGVLLYILDRDYADDAPHHRKAKIVHAILLILLIFSSIGAVFNAILILGNLKVFFSSARPVGIFSHKLFGTAILLETVAGLFALVYLWKMLQRDDMAREVIVKFLPVWGLLKSFSLYDMLLHQNNSQGEYGWALYLLSVGITLGIFWAIRKVYQTPFMLAFFRMESP